MAKKTNKSQKIITKKLPSEWQLILETKKEIASKWRPLMIIVLVYAVLYGFLVLGLSFSSSQDVLVGSSSRLGEAVNTILNQFSNGPLVGSGQSDGAIIIQFLLFIIASMAFIWALRKLQTTKKIRTSEAYYLGTSTIIPTILITFVLLLTLIPSLIGSSILTIALQTGTTSLEIAVVSIIAFLLLLASLYMFVMIWPSFYIVSLAKTLPWQAIKSAAKVTKKHRFNILRKFFILFIVLFILLIIILLPVALLAPSIVSVLGYILLFICFGLAHIYLYTLYRDLL